MKKNINIFIVAILSIFFATNIVKADFLSNAKMELDKNGTSTLSDDKLYITNVQTLPTDDTMYKVHISTTPIASVDTSVCTSKSALPSSTYATEREGSKIKVKVDNLASFEKNSEKLYFTLYYLSSTCYKASERQDLFVTTPTPTERFADVKINIDDKKTTSLSDDIITISNVPLPNTISDYKVVITSSKSDKGNPSDGTPLVAGTSDNYTIATSYYAAKAKNSEMIYFNFYKGTTLLKGSIEKNGNLGANLFKGVKTSFINNTDSSQSNINIKITGIDVDTPSDFYAVFTKEADTSALGSTKELTTGTGSVCPDGSELEKKDSYYILKNASCYLVPAEKKGDTYVTFYRKIKNEAVSTSNYLLKKITNSIKINRPADLALGKRITSKITPTTSLFYLNNLSSFSGGAVLPTPRVRNASYRIGIIDDKTILKNIRDNETEAYEDLLAYAKKAESINSGTIKIYPNEESVKSVEPIEGELYSQSEVKGASYYFFYVNYDGKESDGELYPLEEVQMFSTKENKDGKIEFVSVEDTDWDGLGSESGTGKKPKNPKTGIVNYTLVTLVIAASGLIIYIKTKNITKFPQS